MKKIISAAIITATLFIACNNKSEGPAADKDKSTASTTEVAKGPDQSTPKGVAEIIFGAAQTGDYSKLKDLCHASLEPDADSKHICDVTTGDDELKANFKEHFSKGTVTGEAVIEGDNAKVEILFGPDGTKKETLNMTKKDGKWYLVSF